MEEITFALFIKLVRLQVGIVAFIGLLSLDLLKAWRSKAHWVPAGALVLSAFSLQLLDLLDTDNVSISDNADTKRWELEIVLRNELLIDGGRVFVCVYMGYLLPEMARSRSTSVVWGDIGALALSLFSHILSELYVFMELFSKRGKGLKLSQDYYAPSPSQDYYPPSPSQDYIEYIAVNPLSIASRLCTGVCAMLLFLLLGSAAFAGKTLYNLVAEEIPLALKEKLGDSDEDVFRSWVVAWVCKPDHIITRSVLTSSVGVVVTVPVLCFAAEWATQDYKVLHHVDGLDWLRYTATAFMTLLIGIGWITILFRWIFSIYYFPCKYKLPDKGYFHLEDFWIRDIFEVADDIRHPRQSWDKHVSGGGFLENMKLQLMRAIKVHIFLLRPLIGLQRRLILFSRFCCFLTEKCFFFDKIRLLLVVEADPDFASFEQALEKVKMPGETPQYLLAASLKALKQTKGFMEKGRTEGAESERLIELLRTHSTPDNSQGKEFLEILERRLSRDVRFEYLTGRLSRDVRFEYLTVRSWKMTALSLIQLLLELEGHGASDVLVDAYSQAYDFLDLLDNPTGSDKDMPELFVRAADKQFVHIQQHLRNTAPRETATPQEPHQKVTKLMQNAIHNTSNINSNDSVNWWKIAANNSLEVVCTIVLDLVPRSLPDVKAASSSSAIRSETEDATALTYKVRRILADILAIALKKKAGKALVDNCRNWAKELEDEKIMASVYIAGKLSGVMGEVNRVTQREASDGDRAVRNVGVLRIGR